MISLEAGQVVWYSQLFQNFPVCCDLHKGFGVINEAEVDFFFFRNSLFILILYYLLYLLFIYLFSTISTSFDKLKYGGLKLGV